MKKLYSYILLLSFFTGAIQPVLPMAEYIFSEEGEIAALFNGSCDTICSMTTEEMDGEECKLCDYPDAEDLLDIEYYPIPLQVTSSSNAHILYESAVIYSAVEDQLTDFYYSTIPPPPKFV